MISVSELTCAFKPRIIFVGSFPTIWCSVAQLRDLKELQDVGSLVDLATEEPVFEFDKKDFFAGAITVATALKA